MSRQKTLDAAALVFAIVFPTIVTLVYFLWMKDSQSSWQQISFGVGKVLQFGFPAVYVWLFYREKFSSRFSSAPEIGAADSPVPLKSPESSSPETQRSASNLLLGILFGFAVAIAMFAIYFLLLDGTEVANHLKTMVAEKVTALGVDTVWKYFVLLLFYSIVHSFMEEYYWRWFVFDLLRKFFDRWTANLISSLGFMAHHVVVLGVFFGWASPLTYLFSFSVATGGFVWAWLYGRERSLRCVWVSHAIVDAAIFALGYFMIFN